MVAATAALALLSTAALASTSLEAADVAVIGGAAASPGATLVRGASSSFDLTVRADDGNINLANVNQCDGIANAVTAPTTFTHAGAGLASSGAEAQALPCHHYSGSSGSVEVLTFASRELAAALDAPLGASARQITFGSTGMVRLGSQIILRTAAGEGEAAFTNPSLYVTVNPRPATTLSATAAVESVNLSWSASPDASDITNYVISDGTTSWTALKSEVAKTITGLQAGRQYCFTIKARFVDGQSTAFDSTAEGPACATPTAQASAATATFKQPIDAGAINIAKRGRVVPVKVVLDTGPEATGDGHVSLQQVAAPCDASAPLDAVEVYSATTSNVANQFRWDAAGEHWIYNLDTSSSTINTCYRVMVYVGGTPAASGVISNGTLAGSFRVSVGK